MADQSEIPQFPMKLSRQERKEEKDRSKAFEKELKRLAKGSGWRSAQGTLFRQYGDWFLSNMPTLAYRQGVIVRWTYKPMEIDPLFWRIFNLEENNKMPLSFRDQGAWTVRPLTTPKYISQNTTDPLQLAVDTLDFSNERLDQIGSFTIENMLAEIEPLDSTKGMQRTISVCLLLLLGRANEALDLCGKYDPGVHVFERDSGGFTHGDRTFFDAAREWIVENQNKL